MKKASQFSEQIVSELHEITKDMPEDHMVFFINLPATLGSENGKISVDVMRFGYKHALKLMYGHSPIIVRNGMDYGDLYKIESANDVINYIDAVHNNKEWGYKPPNQNNRHFVTFANGHVIPVQDIHTFDWCSTGWKYHFNNDGDIMLKQKIY